nr:energy transducer TonB [uncultured Holophaga sp.]
MAYTRLGNYLLARELSSDPLGGIHRGLTLSGNSVDQNYLIRVFSDELKAAGIEQHAEDMQWTIGTLNGARGLGNGYVSSPGALAWDYLPGRTLAQVLDKTRQEQIPLGIDHALSVIQGVCQALLQMHARGVHHGMLNPSSIWISFEGATQIVDGPATPAVTGLLERCPKLSAALRPYQPQRPLSPFHADLFALGAIFYELITLEPCPSGEGLQAALASATLKAAQEEAPVPAEIREFLGHLLLGPSFESAEELTASLERVLYDGDYSPTTFNMAFFMHTLFREENEQDQLSMKEDRSADFSAFLPTTANALAAPAPSGGSGSGKWVVTGVVAVLIVLGLFGFNTWQNHQKNAELETKLKALEAASEAAAKADAAKRDALARQESLEKKLREEKRADEQAQLQQQLEETRKQLLKAEQDRKAAQELRSRIANTKAPVQSRAPVEQTPARVQNAAPARYPEAALHSDGSSLERSVTLKVYVDSMGRPQKTLVVSGVPGNYGFDESATAAALASTYQAATHDGKSVPGWVTRTYSFPARPRQTVSSDCQMISQAPIRVSSSARKYLDRERTVTVKIYVDSMGRAQKVLVANGIPGSGIDEAVRDSALSSSYRPAERDGQKVAGWLTKTYVIPRQ